MQREREEEDQPQEFKEKDSPSFRLVQMDSPERISAAAAVHDDSPHQIDLDDGDDDFEFSFIKIPETRSPIAAADDIFSDGKIRPVYPVFNRDLLLNLNLHNETIKKEAESPKSIRLPLRRLFIDEEREQASFSSTSSSSSSSLDELDGIAPGTYCVWAPPSKDERSCKKSSSTGSSSPSRRWRLRDLVVGRSQSDGKEKFVFIPIQEQKAKIESEKGKKKSEVDVVTAQRRMYGQRGGQSAGRRSFLPYRQDLVGFFASVNGLSRTHNQNPFQI